MRHHGGNHCKVPTDGTWVTLGLGQACCWWWLWEGWGEIDWKDIFVGRQFLEVCIKSESMFAVFFSFPRSFG